MRKKSVATLGLVVLLTGGIAPLAAVAVETPSLTQKAEAESIADANLEMAIRDELGITPEIELTEEILSSLENLIVTTGPVKTLAGLERATNLRLLYLGGGEVTDLTPLAGLTQMRTIVMSDHRITDIAPLASLKRLGALALGKNGISSAEALRDLPSLTLLDLSENALTDVKPLGAIDTLELLMLHNNQISDISPLGALGSLTTLSLFENQIADFSPLGTLPGAAILRGTQRVIADPVFIPRGSTSFRAPSLPLGLIPRPPSALESVVELRRHDWDTGVSRTEPMDTWIVDAESTAIGGGFISVIDGHGDTRPLPPSYDEIENESILIEARGTFTSPIHWADITSAASVKVPAGTSSEHAFTATAGFDVARWRMSGQTPGMSMNEQGTLSGTPEQIGSFPVRIAAEDHWGNSVEQSFMLEITGIASGGETTPERETLPTSEKETTPNSGINTALARTGATALPVVGLAALLLAAGAIMVRIRRRA